MQIWKGSFAARNYSDQSQLIFRLPKPHMVHFLHSTELGFPV